MLRNYQVITVTHKEVKLRQLARYKLSANEGNALQVQLHELAAVAGTEELFYLATCNRIVYFFHQPQPVNQSFLTRFFGTINPRLNATDREFVRVYSGHDALEHMARVAGSIDSLVVGEREILRQLREAFDQCNEWGLIGDHLRLAMNFLVGSAKEIYSRTRIGEKPISVVSLAVQQLMARKLSQDARILLVGAGQTNALVAKFLRKYAFRNVTVFNRTYVKAEKLAAMTGGRALPLGDLDNYVQGFDCMIVCTGVHDPIIQKDNLPGLLAGETDRKIIVDLGVPHNVAEGLDQDFPIDYIAIEHLKALAKSNLAFREREVHKAEDLIRHHLQEFATLYQQRQVEKAMRSVPKQIKEVRSHAVNNVFRKEIETLDSDTRALMERMLAYMEKKCIGIPMKAARESVQ